MGKRGELKEIDGYEQKIRDNPKHYSVVFFQPTTSSRQSMTTTSLDGAKDYAKTTLSDPNIPKIRTAIIYAVDENDRHAMVGSMDRSLRWKEVIPARYK